MLTPSHTQPRDESYWQALFAEEEKLDDTILKLPIHSEDDPVDNLPQPNTETPASTDVPNDVYDPWQEARQLHQADKAIDLQVVGFNKGGVLVNWHTLQGFVPASQLLDFPQCRHTHERLEALQKWLHKTITLKVVEVDMDKNRLILSERAAQVSAETKVQLLEELSPGDYVKGDVTNLTDFGAFVDLGGFEGLIHLSELSWSRVSHPLDVVEPGQQVTVKVLRVDRQSDRIALSLKRLKPDPWAEVEERYRPGQLVEGVVSNIVNYGAFIQLEDELEGLVHLSELAEGDFLHPHNVVQHGEKVMARVLTVDGDAKRLALSLRRVNQPITQD